MNSAAVAEPLDIRPPVDPGELARGVLPVFSIDGNPDHDEVCVYAVRDATARLIGFGVTYGWDMADDTIRELDIAMPETKTEAPLAAREAIVRLTDHVFRDEEALECRGRTRTGASSRGFGRLFKDMGGSGNLPTRAVPPSASR